LVSDLMNWIARSHSTVTDLDEGMVERYLRNRAKEKSKHSGDRPALKRFLSVLRDAGMIAPAEPARVTPQDQIFAEFSDHLRERGLAPRSIARHLPTIRGFLCGVCCSAEGLNKINHADVVRYVERHAGDGSPKSAKVMCWSLARFSDTFIIKG